MLQNSKFKDWEQKKTSFIITVFQKNKPSLMTTGAQEFHRLTLSSIPDFDFICERITLNIFAIHST